MPYPHLPHGRNGTNEVDRRMTGGGVDDSGSSRGDRNDTATETERFALGAIVDVLSHPTRRSMLEYLDSHESPVTLAELASELESYSPIADSFEGSIDRQRRLEIDLYHVHAPKMDDAGMATFDQQAQTVTITEAGADAVDLL